MYEYEYAANRMLFGVPDEIPDITRSSGGKENYIGSAVSAIGKVSGSPGIVPGPPEGSRGSTGWGHLYRRAPWAEVGGEPAPSWLVRPTWAPLRLGLETLGGGGRTTCLGGHSTPLGRRPPWEIDLPGPAPPPGGLYKGGQGGGQPHPVSWRLPPPTTPRPPPAAAWRSPAGVLLHPPPHRCAAVGAIFLNLSFPLAGSRRRRRHPLCMCVERGGAVRSALGHR